MATDRTSALGASEASLSEACASSTRVTRFSRSVSRASGVTWPPRDKMTVSPCARLRASISVMMSNFFMRLASMICGHVRLDADRDPTLSPGDSKARRRAGGRNPSRLPRRPSSRRRFERCLHLSVGPGATNDRAGLVGLHGHVELCVEHDHVWGGAALEGSRYDTLRKERRHYRRHRRHRPHADVSPRNPARARAARVADRLSSQQAIAASGGREGRLYWLHDRGSFRGWIWTRLRRAVPESASHRGPDGIRKQRKPPVIVRFSARDSRCLRRGLEYSVGRASSR